MTFTFPDFPDQMGLATTKQLLAAGATESALRHLVRTGHRVHRNVYAARSGLIPDAALPMAGQLWAGSGSILTGAHALMQHGLEIQRRPSVLRYLVPETCRARSRTTGVVTARTKRMPAHQTRNSLRVASIERALVDAARYRELTDRDLKACTLMVLQTRRTTPDRLAAELETARRAGSGGIHDGIMAFRGGAWSVPESTLADGVRAYADLPAMLANPTLCTADGRRIGVPDGYFPDAGVVVQVHSREFHEGFDAEGTDRWADTAEKDLPFQQHGLTVVPVSPSTLSADLDRFLHRLADVVRARVGWDASGIVVQ